jgi:hypothetical protein
VFGLNIAINAQATPKTRAQYFDCPKTVIITSMLSHVEVLELQRVRLILRFSTWGASVEDAHGSQGDAHLL